MNEVAPKNLGYDDFWLNFGRMMIPGSPYGEEVSILARVVLRPNESQEQLLRRFRKQVVKDGVLSTLRGKRWFISKSEQRRIDKKKAIRRARRQD